MDKSTIKVGDIFKDITGNDCTVIEYISSSKILVQYEDGFTQYRKASSLRVGFRKLIKDLTPPNLSEEEHKIYFMLKSKHSSILRRVFNNKNKIKNAAYGNVSIADEWLDFKNFYSWAITQVGHQNSDWHIDKDILFKGNKIYSPETCCFVPARINILFTLRSSKRGDCPIGVSKRKRSGKYKAACRNGEKLATYLGEFTTPQEAFNIYKKYKEAVIKSVAQEYKNYISEDVYDALIKYQIEITD